MAVPTSYLFSTKNLQPILSAVQEAQVPPRFTNEFLKTLGFKSSGDRAVIGVLKSLGFLDASGVPTDRYRRYRNKGQAAYVLAEAIRDAYSDVFLAHDHAETLSAERVRGILATKVDKGEAVVGKMAATFRALVSSAKWDQPATAEQEPTDHGKQEDTEAPARAREIESVAFRYNIEIHLPATKDISIYNAIFRSLREHLL
jgi:hypothetical protein